MLLKSQARIEYFLNCFFWLNNYEAWKEIWLIIKLLVFKPYSTDTYLLSPVSLTECPSWVACRRHPKRSGSFWDNKSNAVPWGWFLWRAACVLASSWGLEPHLWFCLYWLHLHCYYQIPSKSLREEGLIFVSRLRRYMKLWQQRNGTSSYPQ